MLLKQSFNSNLSRLAHDITALGLAVSGGGDSMALLSLAFHWAKERDVELHVATVHHHLREGVDDEITTVQLFCQYLGVEHTVLHWSDWDGDGNLQDQARLARRRLLSQWAVDNQLDCVALGHTEDDVAETFLLRLARSAGVDGLAAMNDDFIIGGARFIRPLLQRNRAELRAYLLDQAIKWCEDPSNQDMKFDRVKMRNALEALEEFGLSRDMVANSANHLLKTKALLQNQTYELAKRAAIVQKIGVVRFDQNIAAQADPELYHRLLRHALTWVSGTDYPPRAKASTNLLSDMPPPNAITLNGCVISTDGGYCEISREPSAMPVQIGCDPLYDGRWRISGQNLPENAEIRPLGERGLKLFKNWRKISYSRRALLSSPSVWVDGQLLSAPFLGQCNGITAHLEHGVHDFFRSIRTH